MTTPRIRGPQVKYRQSFGIDFDPQRGRVITEEYEGAGPHSLDGLMADLESQGVAYSFRCTGTKARLQSTSAGTVGGVSDPIPVDSWQLLANEIQKSVLEAPWVKALDPEDLGRIQTDAETLRTGSAGLLDDTFYTDNPEYARLARMLSRGQNHYAVGQYVLKHTANCSDDYTGLDEVEGEGAIYTTGQLLTEISSGWRKNCPARLRAKVSEVGVAGTLVDGFLWGWRKLPSTETSSANNRIDVSFEYWWDQWSTDFYATA